MIVTKKMLDNEYTGSGVLEDNEEGKKVVAQYTKGKHDGISITRYSKSKNNNRNVHIAEEWKDGVKHGLEIKCDKNMPGPHEIELSEYVDGKKTNFGTHIFDYNDNVFLGHLDENNSGIGLLICDDQIFVGELKDGIPTPDGEWTDAEIWKYQL